MLVLWAWFWRGTEPKHLIEAAEGEPAPEDVPEEPATT